MVKFFSRVSQKLLRGLSRSLPYTRESLNFLTAYKSSSTQITWLFALAMPPRIENIDWSNWETLKAQNSKIQKEDFLQKDQISDIKLLHGGLRIGAHSKSIEVLESDGQHAKVFDWLSFKESAPISISSSEAEKFFPKKIEWESRHSRGRYLISEQRNLFLYQQNNNEQWRHAFLMDLDSVVFLPGTSDLFGFKRYPAHLFYLGWGSGRWASKSVVRTYRWDANSEILSIHVCSSREVMVTENLKNGLFRIVTFELMGSEGLRLKNYILHAWPETPGQKLQFEVTRVIPSDDCRKFILGGSMGVWKMAR